MAEIKMPQLGESVTEGTITKWLKRVGDTVGKDEPLFEVSTDKVDSEVPSDESGVVVQILVEEGDTVEVGTVLAVIGSDNTPVQPAPEPAPVQSAPPVQPAPEPAQVQSAPVVQHQSLSIGARDEVIPFNNIRRRTAEHMVRSKAISAHTLVSIEVDFEGVERVRGSLKEQFRKEEGFSLTYLPFVSRAALEALRTFPRLNASVGDDALIVHKDIHLAIAVDLDLDGLIAPVIHSADTKRLTGLAREIYDLAHRARTKQLSADDISGGTFTITNPGPFGTLITYPIINQPQVAILSTDGIRRKPVVVKLPDGSETIGIHSVGVLAIAFDHRVIDGAYAAAFLARMREIIETWNWAQEF